MFSSKITLSLPSFFLALLFPSSSFPFQSLFRSVCSSVCRRRRRRPTRYMLHCMRRLWSTKPTDERKSEVGGEEEDDESRSSPKTGGVIQSVGRPGWREGSE